MKVQIGSYTREIPWYKLEIFHFFQLSDLIALEVPPEALRAWMTTGSPLNLKLRLQRLLIDQIRKGPDDRYHIEDAAAVARLWRCLEPSALEECNLYHADYGVLESEIAAVLRQMFTLEQEEDHLFRRSASTRAPDGSPNPIPRDYIAYALAAPAQTLRLFAQALDADEKCRLLRDFAGSLRAIPVGILPVLITKLPLGHFQTLLTDSLSWSPGVQTVLADFWRYSFGHCQRMEDNLERFRPLLDRWARVRRLSATWSPSIVAISSELRQATDYPADPAAPLLARSENTHDYLNLRYFYQEIYRMDEFDFRLLYYACKSHPRTECVFQPEHDFLFEQIRVPAADHATLLYHAAVIDCVADLSVRGPAYHIWPILVALDRNHIAKEEAVAAARRFQAAYDADNLDLEAHLFLDFLAEVVLVQEYGRVHLILDQAHKAGLGALSDYCARYPAPGTASAVFVESVRTALLKWFWQWYSER